VLQTPLWVHYRRMDFVRQRTLQAIDPVITLVATLVLAFAGLGVWALVIGALVGTWCASAAMVATSPYKLRFRWDRSALREYTQFSWPLFVGVISTTLLIQVPVVVSSRTLGVTAVAAIALATTISQFTTKVDDVVTQTLYPAICAVKDRRDLLFESFWKSNRLALLWATPLGAAAALFAGDFVHYVIGEKWRFAVPLIAVYGINAALNQIGFNWTAFFRALGDTRPIATGSIVGLVAVMVIAVPLLAIEGLTAFGIGLAAATLISVAARLWFLRRIFPGLAMVGHVLRGMGPTLPAVAAILALRALDGGPRTLTRVAFEAIAFAAVTVAATGISERQLLRESLGYLRRGRTVAHSSV
jgi:O-antigen/teichoic acid export membrane protein